MVPEDGSQESDVLVGELPMLGAKSAGHCAACAVRFPGSSWQPEVFFTALFTGTDGVFEVLLS